MQVHQTLEHSFQRVFDHILRVFLPLFFYEVCHAGRHQLQDDPHSLFEIVDLMNLQERFSFTLPHQANFIQNCGSGLQISRLNYLESKFFSRFL